MHEEYVFAVLVAEIVHHEQPRLVELHNYSSANSIPQKMYNWSTLNQKVFKRHLGFVLAKQELEAICSCEVSNCNFLWAFCSGSTLTVTSPSGWSD